MTRSVDSDAPSDEVPAKQRCDSFSDKGNNNNNNNEGTSPQTTYDRPNYGGKVVGILAGYSQQPELSGPSNTEIQVTYRLLREKLELEEKSEEQAVEACLLNISWEKKEVDFDKEIKACLAVLASWDIFVPRKQKLILVEIEMEKRRWKRSLPNRRVEDLVKLPRTENRWMSCIGEVMIQLAKFSILNGETALATLAVHLSLGFACTHGIHDSTAFVVAIRGFQYWQAKDFRKGFLWAQIAETLFTTSGDQSSDYYLEIHTLLYSCLFPLQKPIQESLGPLLRSNFYGFIAGAGSEQHAWAGIAAYGCACIFLGRPLKPLVSRMEVLAKESSMRFSRSYIQFQFVVLCQVALYLQDAKRSSNGESFTMDPNRLVEEAIALYGPSTRAARDVYTFRLVLAYLLHDLDSAKDMIDRLSSIPHLDPLIARNYLRRLFTGLAAFAVSRKNQGLVRMKYRSIGKACLRYFQYAAKSGSVAAESVSALLEAEESPSARAYKKAIHLCRESVLLEAVANECAGSFYLWADRDWAKFHLTQALELYKNWGAIRKVKLVQRKLRRFVLNNNDPQTKDQKTSNAREESFETQETLITANLDDNVGMETSKGSTTTPSRSPQKSYTVDMTGKYIRQGVSPNR